MTQSLFKLMKSALLLEEKNFSFLQRWASSRREERVEAEAPWEFFFKAQQKQSGHFQARAKRKSSSGTQTIGRRK